MHNIASSSSPAGSAPFSDASGPQGQDRPGQFSAGDPEPELPGRRALVLGGGGSTGNAWLIGVIAGLAEAGIEVADAELVIGTSAGSTAAAQLAGATPAGLFAATVEAQPPHQNRPAPTDAGARGLAGSTVNHLERTDKIIAGSRDAAEMRRRMGAGALELPGSSDESVQTRWRATVAARLPRQDWPEHRVLLTAVDARTGEAVVFGRHSGVALADAVAASCSSGFAYRIGERQYIDGGYRRNENADLAAGYGKVLVLSPFGGRTRTPLAWGMQLDAQVKELRDGGSTVEVISPEAEVEDLFGANAMNFGLRPEAARAGFRQGKGLAGRLAVFWCGAAVG